MAEVLAKDVPTCLVVLKRWLMSVGFVVEDSAVVDEATWQAIAVSVGSVNADRVAGKGVNAAVQLAACNAVRKTMTEMPAEQVRALTFEQKKRLQTPRPVMLPATVGSYVALGLGTVALGVGIFFALRS